MKKTEQEVRVCIYGTTSDNFTANIMFYYGEPILRHDLSTIFFNSTKNEDEFSIYARESTSQYGQGLYDVIPDITSLSEEELFQLSVVWEYKVPIEAVREMQLLCLKHKYQNTYPGNIIETIRY